VISDDETTAIQLAVDANDLEALGALMAPHTAQELSELQLFAHHTLFMYVLENGTVEMVKALIDKGLTPFELEWSDNNELKSTLRNEESRNQLLPLILEWMPKGLCEEMIASDWDPEDPPTGKLESPLEMASKLEDDTCLKLLQNASG
jgi:ankyrin repeat protein